MKRFLLAVLLLATVLAPAARLRAAYSCDADFTFLGSGFFQGYGVGYFDTDDQPYLYVDWADGSTPYYWEGGTATEDNTIFSNSSDAHYYAHGGYYPYVEFGSTTYGYCVSLNPSF